MPERPAFATFHDGANVMYIIDAIVKKPSAAALGSCAAVTRCPASPGNEFMVARIKR